MLLNIFVNLVLGVFIGNIVYNISKCIILKYNDEIKDFNLKRTGITIFIAAITMAIASKFHGIYDLKYLVLISVIITIAIIDYYTHFVYSIIMMPGIIIAIVIAIANGQTNYIFQSLGLALILLCIAYFTGKWYGDIQLIFMITAVSGIIASLFIMLIACVIGLIYCLLTRKFKDEIAFCPPLTLGYLIFLMIV